jgi:hypothetical protein
VTKIPINTTIPQLLKSQCIPVVSSDTYLSVKNMLRLIIVIVTKIMMTSFLALFLVQRRDAAKGYWTAIRRSTDMADWKNPDCIPNVDIK